jgi:methanogenic corrinoid protein MtbC1
MGLWRLQEVMRDIAARTPKLVNSLRAPRSILIAAMPGDQHTFGASMLDEVFARAGWQSELMPVPERRELLNCLSRKSFDLAALTISRDCPSAALSGLIKAMRGVSVNPHLTVLIGGNAVNNNPALVGEVGADGTGSDARAALDVADRLVKATPIRAYELR